MTNTKFRRRALVSSLAMLLVALVALGSATFAWFTENPVVYASGINAKGETSTGLLIATTSHPAYDHSATLMTTGTYNDGAVLTLHPAYAYETESSGTYSLAWFDTQAANAAGSDPAITGDKKSKWNSLSGFVEAGTTSSKSSLGTGIYHEQIKIKPTEGSGVSIDLTGITITSTATDTIKSGVTVLVVKDNHIVGSKKLGSAIKTYAPVAEADVAASTGTWTMSDTASQIGTCGAGTNQELTLDVYVYLDGTDTNVFTNNVSAQQLVDSIVINFAKHS